MNTIAIANPNSPAQTRSLHNDFRLHVEGGWNLVHPDIRDRMDKLLTSPEATVFEGTGCVRRSRIGWSFAQISRLFGAPLVWNQGEDVKTIVIVAPTENGLRCWHRHFTFGDGSTQLVQTSKVVTPDLGLMDAVGAEGEKMLRTKMRVWADDKSLRFESTSYLLKLGRFSIPIPTLLTPGHLTAEHRDEGNGWFRYILAFHHPIWGETFYQDGLFRLMEDD